MLNRQDQWPDWSTAFCKCLTLLANKNQDELDQLLTTASDWSILGARDAIDYFNTCKGQYEFLMLANNQQWLLDYHNKIYTPNPRFNPNNYPTEGMIDV